MATVPVHTLTHRTSRCRVVFDGQSLNIAPGFPNNFPSFLMLGRGVPYRNVAITGTSWTVLQPSAASRSFYLGGKADQAIMVMTGGTSDLALPGDMPGPPPGEANTGAQAYADMNAYATAARSAGYKRILISTVTPSGAFLKSTSAGTAETERQNLNTLIRANSGGYDGICDLAAATNLTDCTNATYYEQVYQTHYTAAGAAVAASVIDPVLTPFLS